MNVHYRKNLNCEADDPSRVNVNKAQVALRALACPAEPGVSHALIQIPKCTQVGESSKRCLVEKGKEEVIECSD